MNISVKFDDRDLQRAFTDYMAYTKKSAQESLQKQIVQLAVGAKGVKGLFQEALATRKETVRDIRSLPARLNFAIRRAPGFSVRQEIARRVQSAGYYQASGWIVPGIAEPRGRGATVKTLRGSIKTTGGINPRVSISNSSPKAFEFGSKTGYIQRALDARARDMLKYVKNKMAREAREFSKPKPNFNIPLSTLESLMSRV